MGLKKRSRVTAQFNMSSLTDIIFLLLIFFMLTSSLVAPNALNLKLPGQANTPTPPSERDIDKIVVGGDCTYRFNGQQKGLGGLETTLRQAARGQRDYTVLISYEERTPTECVVNVMDMSRRYDVNGVLAAPKSPIVTHTGYFL